MSEEHSAKTSQKANSLLRGRPSHCMSSGGGASTNKTQGEHAQDSRTRESCQNFLHRLAVFLVRPIQGAARNRKEVPYPIIAAIEHPVL
jgi:hypothetical protein